MDSRIRQTLTASPAEPGGLPLTLEGLAGWRYLLSPTYRRTVHARWAQMSRIAVIIEVLLFLVSFIFVTLLIGGGIWLLFW